jgi:hypothetical protein
MRQKKEAATYCGLLMMQKQKGRDQPARLITARFFFLVDQITSDKPLLCLLATTTLYLVPLLYASKIPQPFMEKLITECN